MPFSRSQYGIRHAEPPAQTSFAACFQIFFQSPLLFIKQVCLKVGAIKGVNFYLNLGLEFPSAAQRKMQIQLVVIIVFAVFLKLGAVFHVVVIKQAARFGRIDAEIGRPRQRTASFADAGIIFAGNGQTQNVIDAVKMAANAGKLLLQTVNVAVLLKALVDFAHFGHLFDPIILNFSIARRAFFITGRIT